MAREALTGWGRTAPTAAEVVRPPDAGAVASLLASLTAAGAPGRGAIARGLGRSYGDAAQNAGGTVLSTAALDHLAWADEDAGLLRVGAGTSIEAIMRSLLPRGWFVPETPATGTPWRGSTASPGAGPSGGGSSPTETMPATKTCRRARGTTPSGSVPEQPGECPGSSREASSTGRRFGRSTSCGSARPRP